MTLNDLLRQGHSITEQLNSGDIPLIDAEGKEVNIRLALSQSEDGLVCEIEKIFPKLKESGDGRVKKAITHILYENYTDAAVIEGVEIAEIVAWLERQGEQKETLCDKCKKTQPSHSCQDITALGRCALEKQGEQKSAFGIGIPFGAKDSELIGARYYIPEGFHAEIEGNNVVIKKGEQKLDDKVEPFKVGDWVMYKNGACFSDGSISARVQRIEGRKVWLEHGTYVDELELKE